MTRIVLVPIRTADGRHVILRGVAVTPLERLARWLGRRPAR